MNEPKKHIEGVIITNKAKCRDCNRCVRHCPVKAIKIEHSQAAVIHELCIACGICVLQCPQKAKQYRNEVEKVKQLIRQGSFVALSVAPSYAAAYSEWERKRLPSALRQIGFSYIGETAIGAYHTALKTKEFIETSPKKSYIFTACPSVVSYVEKYAPKYIPNLVPVVSPMIAHGKLIKEKYSNAKIVFVGPCIAKKAEAERAEFAKLFDAVITFEELNELLKWKNVIINQCEESSFNEEPGLNSRLYPIEGGMLKTAMFDTDLISQKILSISGVDELNDALELISDTSEAYIIEPLFCENGCINGPAMEQKTSHFKFRSEIIKYNETNKGVTVADVDFSKLKTFYTKDDKTGFLQFDETQILETLKKTGKIKPEDELNCGACGYSTCRLKAAAVLSGLAELEMCVPYMRRLAEAKTDLVLKTDPNGVIILDGKLQICSLNPAFKKMFSCSDAIIGKKISYLIDPDPFERLLAGEAQEIRKVVHYPSYNLISHQICYSIKEENQYIGIFVNITDIYESKERIKEMKSETIIQAQELIEHQIQMAQDLARFLGENTAKGELLMNKLIDSINK